MKITKQKYIDIAESIIDANVEFENELITNEELELNEFVIGILEIQKLDLKAPIRDGTLPDILNDSIGHFKNTKYWNGNVGLAAHNRGLFISHYFERINELSAGDQITYKTKFGVRNYEVTESKIIDSNDWSELSRNCRKYADFDNLHKE